MQDSPRPQVEAGMMERTPDSAVLHQAASERRPVVGTKTAHREQLAVETGEENRLVAYPTGQAAVRRDFSDRDPV